MDIEDPINPLADPAALDISELFTNLSVRASMCITGEKCRSLMSRNRQDILTSLKSHCIGLHTNTHSQHPSTMELLADVDYETGCRLALDSERKGHDSFVKAFGQSPTFWGGAGNTWSPEINAALSQLQVPAYSYSLIQTPNHRPHRINGILGLPQAYSIGEDQWADDQIADQRSNQVLKAIQSATTPWLGIFVGHPTRFRHDAFWDSGYFGGKTAEPLPFANVVDEKVYMRSLINLRSFLVKLKSVAKIVGVDELLELKWNERRPSDEEIQFFRSETPKALAGAAKWPIHRPDLDPANIIQKTLNLENTLLIAEPE